MNTNTLIMRTFDELEKYLKSLVQLHPYLRDLFNLELMNEDGYKNKQVPILCFGVGSIKIEGTLSPAVYLSVLDNVNSNKSDILNTLTVTSIALSEILAQMLKDGYITNETHANTLLEKLRTSESLYGYQCDIELNTDMTPVCEAFTLIK